MTAKFGSTKPYTNKDKNNLEFPGKLQVSNETSSLHGKSIGITYCILLYQEASFVCVSDSQQERKGKVVTL